MEVVSERLDHSSTSITADLYQHVASHMQEEAANKLGAIGRTHAGAAGLLLIADLDIRVVNTTTGELLRHLRLNPDIGYQTRRK